MLRARGGPERKSQGRCNGGLRPLFPLSEEVKPLWDALYQAGAEVAVNGHDHTYSSGLRPKPPKGIPTPTEGYASS